MCTKSEQVRELSRKASLPTSNNFAPGSDFHHLAELQTDFAPNATDDEIKSEPNRMERRVGLSFASSTTYNCLEPGSIDNVASREPPFGYENNIVSMNTLIEITSELVLAFRWFS